MRRLLAASAIAALFAAAHSLAAQVSPGPLARAHRELEGSLKCTRCHAGGGGRMESRCLACHRDVAWLAERSRGLHGGEAAKGRTCASCHPDHAGVDFALIQWAEGGPERFEHRRAGWPLTQSHAASRVRCADCHQAKYRVSPAAPLAPQGRSRWTGLEPGCAACHEDPHRSALGARCLDCHDAAAWAMTPGFSHDTTAYPLTGQHRNVGCDACHLAPRLGLRRDAQGRPVPRYRPVPFGSCAACHADVHRGSFGANCSGCHSTRAFAEISGNGFDHGRTAFPLRGGHAGVPCASCHRDFSSERGRRPAAGSCAACHAPDPHAGTATLGGQTVDCAACHSDKGFRPASFSVAAHRESRYPLEGRHATVPCAACHIRGAGPGPAKVMLRPGFATCTSCHADAHGGQLTARAGQGECAECHTPAGWAPSGFGPKEHAGLALPLEGRHAEVACLSCHGMQRAGLAALAPSPGGVGQAGFRFAGVERSCEACHRDPHAGKFAARCPACHDAVTFRPASVDAAVHERFAYQLRGAHRAVACASCHRELAGEAPARGGSLIASGANLPPSRFEADTACASCHKPVHGRQFDGRRDGGRCESCHTEDGFTPASRFDHERDASFSLGKGHQKVACLACHRARETVAGLTRVLYRPLSGKCESCHLRNPAG